MEVADQIVVMNAGRIEQIGAPRELYEQPGERVRDELRRPGQPARRRVRAPARHRADARAERVRRAEAMVERVVHLGFEVRVELVAATTASALSAQLTREEAEQLELAAGAIVFVRPRHTKVFAP